MRFPDPDKSRLILLGTSGYEHETLDNLPSVTNCLSELRNVLTSSETGGFLSEHCLFLENDVEPRDIASRIQQFAATANDTLAVWFIGHGLFDIRSRKLHLALSRTDPQDLYYTALPFEHLRDAILASPAEVKILMLDCCFSGKAISEMVMGSSTFADLISEEVAVEGTYIMTACSGREIALTLPGAPYTVFTGTALDALRRAIPLPMGDLFREVSRTLRGQRRPVPHQASNGTAADLALVRGAAAPARGTSGGVAFTLNPPDDPASKVRGQGASMEEFFRAMAGRAEAWRRTSESTEPDAVLGPLSAAEVEERIAVLRAEAEVVAEEGSELPPGEVIAILRKIITEMLGLGEPDHLSVLRVRDLHALWLGVAGRYEEAARLCHRLVRTREELHGPEHGDVLTSRHNLAHIVGLTGDTTGAVRNFESIVEDRKRILGDRNRDTLLSMDALAYWVALDGDTLRAVNMYRALYEEDDWRSGPNDERTLKFLSRLAWAQGLANDASGAHSSYSELTERWASLDRPESPETLKFREFRDQWGQKGSS